MGLSLDDIDEPLGNGNDYLECREQASSDEKRDGAAASTVVSPPAPAAATTAADVPRMSWANAVTATVGSDLSLPPVDEIAVLVDDASLS